MAIPTMARKVLWARSANQCAFPDCSQELTVDLQDAESEILSAAGVPLGEEAHIVSGSADGPRFDADYPKGKVDSYENLVLLCPTHHRLIDKRDGVGYTADQLRKMKVDHEASVSSRLTMGEKKSQEIELRTLAMVEHWCKMSDLSQWENLTWRLNVPVPRLKSEFVDSLYSQGKWLMAKNWPASYPQTRRAFDNYYQVLKDLVNHLRLSMETASEDGEVYEIRRRHKRVWMTQPEYDKSLKDFEQDRDVLYRLSEELTKSVNFVIDAVRSEIDPLFRFEEGFVLHRVGDGIFEDSSSRLEYSAEETERPIPYIGSTAINEAIKGKSQ